MQAHTQTPALVVRFSARTDPRIHRTRGSSFPRIASYRSGPPAPHSAVQLAVRRTVARMCARRGLAAVIFQPTQPHRTGRVESRRVVVCCDSVTPIVRKHSDSHSTVTVTRHSIDKIRIYVMDKPTGSGWLGHHTTRTPAPMQQTAASKITRVQAHACATAAGNAFVRFMMVVFGVLSAALLVVWCRRMPQRRQLSPNCYTFAN